MCNIINIYKYNLIYTQKFVFLKMHRTKILFGYNQNLNKSKTFKLKSNEITCYNLVLLNPRRVCIRVCFTV